MKKMALYVASAILALSGVASANSQKQDLLIKLAPGFVELEIQGAKVEKLSESWVRVQAPRRMSLQSLEKNPAIEYVQPNYKISLLEDYKIEDPLRRAAFAKILSRNPQLRAAASQATQTPASKVAPGGVDSSTIAAPRSP